MKTQECNRCGDIKNITEFEHQKNRPNPRKTCKVCRQKNRTYTPEQIEKKRLYSVKKREEEGYYEYYKNLSLKRNYNITLNDFNVMLSTQDNKCEICGKEFINSKDIHVDHNHSSGKVRALLCSNCNSAIGMLKENIDTLNSAIRYLKKYN